ncbi:putative nuclease HARBI1 [Homalodisca vitripennis]|uniref:putative nuclease HARBI1 n=1 Tax=Homalodisca vitripennis TaxID=197043 RepID=UPI001EEAA145|nr:putative nuclease HARBI1 [Homalodisca vitripennis]
MDSIVEKAPNWIHFPNTIQEVNDAKLLWQTRFNLPTVIGALDSVPDQLQHPSVLSVLVVCMMLGCGEEVKLEKLFLNLVTACLLGDSGYGIAPWLITPYKPPQNEQQRNFNLQHAMERVVIERVFGQLKKLFPVLGNCIRVSLDRVPKTIISCAVLHNVGKHLNMFDNDNIEDDFNGNLLEGEQVAVEQVENAITKL